MKFDTIINWYILVSVIHVVTDDGYDTEALNGDQDELDVFNNMQRHVANVYKRLHFFKFCYLVLLILFDFDIGFSDFSD